MHFGYAESLPLFVPTGTSKPHLPREPGVLQVGGEARGFSRSVTCVAVCLDGVIAGDDDGDVFILPPSDQTPKRMAQGHQDTVNVITMASDYQVS